MTEVQRRFVDGFLPTWQEAQVPYILEVMKSTSYHEAAHVVGRAFTGLEFSHIHRVSIIPDEKTLGRETSERNLAEGMFQFAPQRSLGYMLLLGLLAGHCAEARLSGDLDSIDDQLYEEEEREGTDTFRALKIASAMEAAHMPVSRVMTLAKRWTFEMLSLPTVWNAVDQIAQALSERGVIDDVGELSTICDRVIMLGCRLPKWKRRLVSKT